MNVKLISKIIHRSPVIINKGSFIKNMESKDLKDVVDAISHSKPLFERTAGTNKVIKISCAKFPFMSGVDWSIHFDMKYKGLKGIINRMKEYKSLSLTKLSESESDAQRFKTSEEIQKDIQTTMAELSKKFKPTEDINAHKLFTKNDQKLSKEIIKNL